jgi:hypothetical protein
MIAESDSTRIPFEGEKRLVANNSLAVVARRMASATHLLNSGGNNHDQDGKQRESDVVSVVGASHLLCANVGLTGRRSAAGCAPDYFSNLRDANTRPVRCSDLLRGVRSRK